MFRALDASFFLSIYRSSFIFFISLTHFSNLLQSNYIDIESMRSQCEMKNLKYLWNINDAVEWIIARIVNVLHYHSRIYRNVQTKNVCFMMYRLFNSRYQYSYRCFILWRCIFRTSQFFRYSIARFTNRLYVIFEVNKSSNFDSFESAIFASMCDLTQNLLRWKSLLENFKQCIVEKISKIISLKKFVDNNDNHSRFSIDRESVALKKLARKFQITHRWENFKIHRFERISDIKICIVEKICTKISNWSKYLF